MSSRTAGNKDGTFPGSVVAAYVTRSLPAMLLLVAIEFAYIHLSYASRFLRGIDHVLLAAQGLALAVLLAWIITLAVLIFPWLTERLQYFSLFRRSLFGLRISVLGVVVIGVGVLSAGGRPFEFPPVAHLVGLCLLVFLIYVPLRRLCQELGAAAMNGSALISLSLCSWFLMGYLPMFFQGELGLADPLTALRSMIIFGVPSITIVGLPTIILAHRHLRGGWKLPWWGQFIGVTTIVLIIHVSARYYVDSYLEIHTWLLLVALSISWLMFCSLDLSIGRSRNRGLLIVLVTIGSVFLLLGIGVRSNTGYVGAVHTVVQRFALETFYDRIPQFPSHVEDRIRYVQNRWRRLRGRPLPVEQDGALPTGFAPIRKTPGFARSRLQGVVLILLDMKRPRDIGRYGIGTDSRTPEIDECFAESVVFERAYTAATSTSFAYSAMYTSTYGATRRQLDNTILELPFWFAYQNGNSLGKVFRKAGFKNVVVANRFYAKNFFDLDSAKARFGHYEAVYGGFDVVPEVGGPPESITAIRRAYEGARPIPRAGRYLTVVQVVSHPLSELREVDAFVGEVCEDIRAQGRWSDTVLLLTADHGVQFREHGRSTYGRTVFDEEALVPLLVRVPGLPSRRVIEPVSGLDHLPTLIDLFGLEVGFEVEGRSYVPALIGKPVPSRPIFVETRTKFPTVGVIRGDFKLVWWEITGTMALFDLSRDPEEVRNLIDDDVHASKRNELIADLERFLVERGETL